MSNLLALCGNDRMFSHSTLWNHALVAHCEQQGIPFEVLDPYRPDIITQLDRFQTLIWPIQNYVWADIMQARSILLAAVQKGLDVFPDHGTIWHFDDKIAQMYALQAIQAPIPRSWVFYLQDDCLQWLEHEARYPLVAKLRNGSGSSNVKLLKTAEQAKRYARRMFGKGFDPSPSLLYKAYSKAQSSRDWKTALSRIKRIPEFLQTLSHAKKFPMEKGYCYFQEFVPNQGFDIKVAVVGKKLSYFARHIRKGDFRASGGGDFFYDHELINDSLRRTAFEVSRQFNMQCMGFDFVVDQTTGQALIVEMCYGFDWEAVFGAGCWWDEEGNRHDEPLHVPV
ncbi:MAG TPA: hypothetical protein PLF62_11580, partial [Clostridia bacterium]|nr:hypothetical protein [Clostridia bacterium]